MLPLLGRTSLAVGLCCAHLTAQFVFNAKDAPIPLPPTVDPIMAVSHGTAVLGIDGLGNTLTWSSVTSTWTMTAVLPIAPGFCFTRGNTAWSWDPVGRVLTSFNGSAWVVQTWSGGPPGVLQTPGVATLPNGDVIFFGGWDGTSVLNQTWRLDVNNVWTLVTTTGPLPRNSPSMATDAAGNVILFGGNNNPTAFPTYYTETWSFNGTTWTQLFPATSPPGRVLAGMAFHPLTQSIVLVGGTDQSLTPPADAWEFTGGNWLPAASSTYASSGIGAITLSAAFDNVSSEIVMPVIGGMQTVVVGMSGFRNFGGGCVCDFQPAPYVLQATGTATLNGAFTLTSTNTTPGNALAIAFDSIQAFPPFPGPGPGPGGCPIFPFNWTTQFFLAGTVAGPFNVGTNPAMIGQVMFLQGIQPPLFGLNGCTSNAVEVRFGR